MAKKGAVHFYVKIVLGLLMLLFAYFQLNDPDPWIWVTIYSIIALLCFVSAVKKLPRSIYYIVFIGLMIYGLILIPEIIDWVQKGMPSIVAGMKAEEPHIEFMREFLGLGICMGIVVYCLKKSKGG